jgi:PDDEXK-like domain of unknown function (DUF3799)
MNLDALCPNGLAISCEPGLYMQFDRHAYDAIPAFSATVLKKWLTLGAIPSEFAYWLKERWHEPPTEALLLGAALDCSLLEPKRFHLRYAVIPESAPARPTNRQRNAKKPSEETLAAIAWWDKFNAEAQGKTILSAGQHEICLRMRDAVQAAPSIEGVFEHCQKVVLVGELFGLPCKAEIDLWNPTIAHIFDLKSAIDVLPDAFAYAASVKFGYVEQAVFYLELARACGHLVKEAFTFIAVKNAAPWTVRAYPFMPFEDSDHWTLYETTRAQLQSAAKTLARRFEDNDFRDNQDWVPLKFPEYLIRQAKLRSLEALQTI